MASVAAAPTASIEDAVRLVPSRRGKEKAVYGGRTFTLEQHNGDRYRWRCDVRTCKARLTTDVYDGRHMVYRFRQHDEEPHKSVTRERATRKGLASYKQQVVVTFPSAAGPRSFPSAMASRVEGYHEPSVEIGEYRYILENVVEGVQFWRCEFVRCPGRCRTKDGVIVAGPSLHVHDAHLTAGDGAAADCAQVKSIEEAARLDRETDHFIHEMAARIQQNPSHAFFPSGTEISSTSSGNGADTTNRIAIKSEPASPIVQVEINEEAMVHTDDANVMQSRVITPDNSVTADFEEQPRNVENEADDMESSDQEADDNEPGSRLLCIASYKSLANRSDVPSGSGAALGSSSSRLNDVLSLVAGSQDPREKELRVDVLLQMRRLLEAETDLLVQKQRSEALRTEILRRKLSASGKVGDEPGRHSTSGGPSSR
ncbi:uncharacterized protein LOC8039314 isoform X2 [Ixodes scapularis]|uniref:uncharacterized protein LOC8039314 isoform X2 n=1 Tax=Ixodes scapularis TaxID=6945 RepID=UPI001A9FEE5E|nr:uncharacterized protein LOC8039314 isoform X2 [Ixodes scapularis]